MASLFEWLVEFDIIKKGSYQHYETKYYIDNPDPDDVWQKIDNYYRGGWRLGALTVDSDRENGTINVSHIAGQNIVGDQMVFWEMNIELVKENGKTLVMHELYDYKKRNARFDVENCRKSWQKKYAKK